MSSVEGSDVIPDGMRPSFRDCSLVRNMWLGCTQRCYLGEIGSLICPHVLQVWQLYQYASLFPGKNAVEVNGIDEGLTSQSKSDDATLLGMATASTRGEVVFGFKRNAHHVHLSGLAIRKRNEAWMLRVASHRSSWLVRLFALRRGRNCCRRWLRTPST